MLRHGTSSILKAAQRWQTCPGALQAVCMSCATQDLDTRHVQPLSRGFARVAEADDEDIVEPSERVKQIAEDIMHLNLLEVADLTDILQKRLGMNTMPVGMGGFGAPPQGAPVAEAAAPAAAAAAPAVEEKTSFDVKLDGFDAAAKIKVIKEIRVITELGLKEAKEMVEKSPVVIKAGLKKDEAEELRKKLEAVGGKVSLE